MRAIKSSQRARIYYLHGNLQNSNVWLDISRAIAFEKSGENGWSFEHEFENLWDTSADRFQSWTDDFCSRVAHFSSTIPQFLVGYSLGGRLALHSIIERPSLWNGAIVVGADPGISDKEGRAQQLLLDKKWGERFLSESWTELLNEWDSLSVFGSRPNTIPREECNFSRQKISRFFDVFSKGRQEDLLPALSKIHTLPILFVSGEQDTKYCEIGRKLERACPLVNHAIVPNATHRVPWENSEEFVRITQNFIRQNI